MLRIFVERKVRRQIVRLSLGISLLAFAAILALWTVESLSGLAHPLRLFINNIHGGLSALAIQLSGGAVESFTVSPQGSYLITFNGGAEALVYASGYLGSALLGALLFFIANRVPHLVRGLSVITGVFTIGFVLAFIRPDHTGDLISIAICVGLGAALIVLGWTGKGDINQLRSRRSVTQIVMNIVALTTALHVILDLRYLLSAPAKIESEGVTTIMNPVAAFAESVMPGASVDVVALAWSLVALALTAAAIWFSMIKPYRQIPKDDDIV